MGTIYLLVPKVRQGGYIPFFVSNRKRSEAALIQVVQEAFVNGVSTRKMERLAKSLGIENLSRSPVSNMAKEMDGQVEAFRNRLLKTTATRCCGWMLCMKRFVTIAASSAWQF
jgi:transposase-like protein